MVNLVLPDRRRNGTPTLELDCGEADERGRRVVIARFGNVAHRHRFDTDDQRQRREFREAAISKLSLDDDAHGALEEMIVNKADAADQRINPADLASANVVSLNTVAPLPVHWLWDGSIPRGAITLIDGDPNEGKSQLVVDLAARVSSGRTMPPLDLPSGEPASVLLMSAEDDLERTIVPRLQAARADLSHVHHMRTVTPWDAAEPRTAQLPLDLPTIEQTIVAKRVRLVGVDVLSSFLQSGLNMNSDADMRSVMDPLAAVAQRTQSTWIVLRHMNKKEGTRSMYRGGGSVAIVGAARAAFAVGPHPDDPNEKVFAAIKHNLGPRPASLTYHIEPAGQVSRIVWGGQTSLTAADVLKSHPSGGGGGPKFQQAKEIIIDILAAGSRGSNEVEQACLDAGISKSTYWGARKALSVRAEKSSFNGDWILSLANGDGGHSDEF